MLRQLLNSDAWANGLPIGLVVCLLAAIALGGCSSLPKPGAPSDELFWSHRDRWAGGGP